MDDLDSLYRSILILMGLIQKTCTHSKGTLNYFRIGGDVLVRLSDIADAISINSNLKASHPEWSVEFISPALFTEVCQAAKIII
jgi:hypothetical protein